jgi:hypothetical protein
MRYSGLRIGDAVTCERERLVKSKLFLYQAKTGTPVCCPLPPAVIEALNEVKGPNPKYFFWTGNGKVRSAVADAQRSFRKLFELAEVERHPHMFRDTFAVELLKHGVTIETVAPPPVGAALSVGRTRPPACANAAIRTPVMKIAAANPLWGAPRIHGELGKLAIAVSERTVSRLVRRPRRPREDRRRPATVLAKDRASTP